MQQYRIIKTGEVVRLDEMAPHFPDTAYGWNRPLSDALAAFLGVEAVEPAPPAPPTPEQIAAQLQADVLTQVQQLLDDTARGRGYDSILSACSYIASTVPRFAAEAQACVNFRDACWNTCYAIMGAVQAGERPLPTVQEVLGELPAIGWPV